MNRIPLSNAAAGVIRALAGRSGASRNRILLIDAQSVDWQSLTLNGERHEFAFRVGGPGAQQIVDRMCSGLSDEEFSIPGVIVADVAVVGNPAAASDGSITFTIEALTVAAD